MGPFIVELCVYAVGAFGDGRPGQLGGWDSSSVVGGCDNVAGTGTARSGFCSADIQSVLGGFDNTASGLEATVSGGWINAAKGAYLRISPSMRIEGSARVPAPALRAEIAR